MQFMAIACNKHQQKYVDMHAFSARVMEIVSRKFYITVFNNYVCTIEKH